MTKVRDPLGRERSRTYDKADRVLTERDPTLALTTYVYDDAGREIERIDARNHTWLTRYTDAGRVDETEDPLGQVTVNVYDGRGRLAAVASPEGRVVRYGYDNDGRQTSVTRQFGATPDAAKDLDRGHGLRRGRPAVVDHRPGDGDHDADLYAPPATQDDEGRRRGRRHPTVLLQRGRPDDLHPRRSGPRRGVRL